MTTLNTYLPEHLDSRECKADTQMLRYLLKSRLTRSGSYLSRKLEYETWQCLVLALLGNFIGGTKVLWSGKKRLSAFRPQHCKKQEYVSRLKQHSPFIANTIVAGTVQSLHLPNDSKSILLCKPFQTSLSCSCSLFPLHPCFHLWCKPCNTITITSNPS